jgi:hypothetical protein
MSKLKVYRAMLVALTAADLLCAVVLAPVTFFTSPMMFDAPGSEQLWWVWVLFFVWLSIPLWFVAAPVLGWVLHRRRGWMVGSLLVAAGPLACIALLLIAAVFE